MIVARILIELHCLAGVEQRLQRLCVSVAVRQVRQVEQARNGTGAAGSSMKDLSSSSLKMRSDEAMAVCMILYFSDRSRMGRQNISLNCTKAMIVPSVTVPPKALNPAYQMMRPIATAPMRSTPG